VELDAPVDGDAPTGALTRRRAQSMDKPVRGGAARRARAVKGGQP
jgi:hypothetical protein